MTVPETPAFGIDDRVQIHNERSVLHGLAGTVVEVDHVREDPYRVRLDGDLYPMWLQEWELRAEPTAVLDDAIDTIQAYGHTIEPHTTGFTVHFVNGNTRDLTAAGLIALAKEIETNEA